MSNIVFVTGGAKSGKSAFAESLCNVIDASVFAYNNMATFEEVGMKI